MRGLVSALVLASLAVGGAGAASAQVLNGSQTPKPVATTPAHGTYTVEPFTPASAIVVNGTGVRFRAEPFTGKDTPVLSAGSTGLALSIVGLVHMGDWNWYQVVLKNGQKAFIRSDLTSAPSRGNAAPSAAVAYTPPAPNYPQPIPVIPPAPKPAVTIEPAPVVVSPAPVVNSAQPAPVGRSDLDLPSPTAPAGLQSKPQ